MKLLNHTLVVRCRLFSVSGSLCSRSGFFRFSSSHQGTLETPNGRRTHTTRLDHANLGKIASTVREGPGDEVGTPWRLRAYRSRLGASRPPGGSIRGARCQVSGLRGRKSNNAQNGSKTTQKLRRDDNCVAGVPFRAPATQTNEQLNYDLAVLVSSKSGEWVTCTNSLSKFSPLPESRKKCHRRTRM